MTATADSALRRLQSASLDDSSLIDSLTSLVLGSTAVPGAAGAAATGAAAEAPVNEALTKRSAASVAVRLRALSYLSKSRGAANRFPGTLQAIFTSVFGTDATPKLQQVGVAGGAGGARMHAYACSSAHAPAPTLQRPHPATAWRRCHR